MIEAKRHAGTKPSHKKHKEYILISAILSSGILYTTASVANSVTTEVPLSKNQLALPTSEQTSGLSKFQEKTTATISYPEHIAEFPWAKKPAEALTTGAKHLTLAISVPETAPSPSAKKPTVEAPGSDTLTAEALTTGTKHLTSANPLLETLATTASALKAGGDSTPQIQQPTPQLAQGINLSDVQGHWAQSFIMALADRDIIRGYPDGTFRPEAPVTRAEFAAMINKAFPKTPVRQATNFVDVPAAYWANEAIQAANTRGFLTGYGNRRFNPKQNIPRVQVLVALANGLNLSPTAEAINFQDGSQIPDYARTLVAAATANRIVVNYPNVAVLNPNQRATRADVAAFIYQALVNAGTAPPLAVSDNTTQYIVGYQPPSPPQDTPTSQVAEPTTPPATEPTTAEITPQEIQRLQNQIQTLQNLKLRQRYLLIPSVTGFSPSAFGASWGQGFVGIGAVNRTRFTKNEDAAIAAGIGLGDASRIVGLESTLNIYSLRGDDAFQAGSVDFKLHRLLGSDLSIAAGVENLTYFGASDTQRTGYGVISKVFRLRSSSADLFSRLYTSIGVGAGRFRTEDDIIAGKDSLNVFGTLGLQIAEPLSVYADWMGQDLFLGASLVPFRNVPLVISPSLQDVTGNAGDGMRFGMSIGYQFSF